LDELIRSRKIGEGSYCFGETEYKVEEVLEIPVWIGKEYIHFRTEVIAAGDVPWIIGTKTLKNLGAVINLEEGSIICRNCKGMKKNIKIDENGHVKICWRNSEVCRKEKVQTFLAESIKDEKN